MALTKVTQAYAEVLEEPSELLRVTQAYAEVLQIEGPEQTRVTQAYAEVLAQPPPPVPVNAPAYLRNRDLLGCGDTQVFIQERGGNPLLEVPYSSLSWGRKLDDISETSECVVPLGGNADRCCDVLKDAEPWSHELSIRRDGDEVFVGVLKDPVFKDGEVRLSARDLFWWFERRQLAYDRNFSFDDLSDIFRQYALDALSLENSMGITVSSQDCGQIGSRTVLADEHRRAADELRELGRSGVDFTMLNRELLVSGQPTVATMLLVTEDFADPTITKQGTEQASQVIIRGTAPDAGTQVSGSAGGVHPRLGLVTVILDEDSISDTYSANQAASAQLRERQTSQRVLESPLLASAGVGMGDLIPGRMGDIRVQAGCESVIGFMRLVELAVKVSVTESGITETVTPTFIPISLD